MINEQSQKTLKIRLESLDLRSAQKAV